MKRPNILLIAIDSLRRDRMSCYGYHRLTTPHIDRFAQGGTLFEETVSSHIPTTAAYASMLSGMDCFGTNIVALRHRGTYAEPVQTLPEMLKEHGYETTCVGFPGNPASRGFDNELSYKMWGTWEERPLTKAQSLNEVAQPEIDRLHATGEPWMMMLRHMDPHSPYLPPAPYDRMFYHGDECDPANHSLDEMKKFKPFRDYLLSWMPPGITDAQYINAQYDGAVAYMDACIARIFQQLDSLGILDNTIVIINGDHGETLDEHQCWFDHHGLYEPCLVVPLIIRYPKKLPAGKRVAGWNQHKDLVPTVLELAGLPSKTQFDGQSLLPLVRGERSTLEREQYITECTWMRKHGWRTPQWKLIVALEPDFHFFDAVELYDLREDPQELRNVAKQNPDVVKHLQQRMQAYISARTTQTGRPNPMDAPGNWSGKKDGPFVSSDEAYDTLHIGSSAEARKLQEQEKKAAAASQVVSTAEK